MLGEPAWSRSCSEQRVRDLALLEPCLNRVGSKVSPRPERSDPRNQDSDLGVAAEARGSSGPTPEPESDYREKPNPEMLKLLRCHFQH